MTSAGAAKKVPTGFPNRPTRSRLVRLMRLAVAFLVVAGSLGLATVAATAQSSSSTCPSAGASAYADLTDQNNYAYDDSRCLKELGIPAPGDFYRPDDEMTRSEMARFMARTYATVTGSPAPVVDTDFTDVDADDPNAADIARIFGLGITRGTTATTYSPNDSVIRGHMALFLSRLYRQVTSSDAPEAVTGFTDISARGSEQESAIRQIFGLGVTTGTTDTTYSPGSVVTRRQMASFVARMYRVLDALPSTTLADAPTDLEVEVSGSDGTALEVRWTPPADSSDVTGYVVQWKSGDDDFSDDNERSVRGASTNFEDLTLGETYTFRVATVTALGTGDWSEEISGNPAVVPGLVGDLESTPRNASLALSWETPADDGGSEITGYVIRYKTGRQATRTRELDDGEATSYTIEGLTNSVPYFIWVQAVNAAGTGDSARLPNGPGNVSVTPIPTGPTVPRDLTVTPGDRILTLQWTAPQDDGGTTFTGYTIERRCGSETRYGRVGSRLAHNTRSVVQTIPIRNLVNGTLCDVQVAAESYYDANGNNRQDSNERTLRSPWVQATGTPAALPSPPTNVTVTTAHQSLQVSWTPPINTGGSEITGYRLTWSAGIPMSINVGNRTSYTITGLENRFSYTVNVRAVTSVGESIGAFAVGSTMPNPVPAAPLNVRTMAAPLQINGNPNVNADTSLVVAWDAPPPNGTNPVNGYVVQRRNSLVSSTRPGGDPTPAGAWSRVGVGAVNVASRTVTITGLLTGTSYDIRVQATNDHDDDLTTLSLGGPWAQGSGTPAGRPEAVAPILEPGFTSILVSWVPPADNGSDITHYLVRYTENLVGNETWNEDVRVEAPARNVRITGLTTRVPYVVQVQAVNAVGAGPNASEVETATGNYPDPPTLVRAVPTPNGNGRTLTVTWNRVTQTNGSGPLKSYTVEVLDVGSQGSAWVPTPGIAATATSATVNVTPGRSYLVRVKAIAGLPGSSGYIDAPVTAAGAPPAPTRVAATVGQDGSTINVVWTAVAQATPSDIIGYTVSWFSTTDPIRGSRGSATVTSNTIGTYAIVGLPPDTYTVQVSAFNQIGDGRPAVARVTISPR